MLGIRRYIDTAKEKFRTAQRDKFGKENARRAEELKRLREERIRAEGRVKLERAREKELARLRKAKEATPSGARKIAKNLAKVINESKERSKKKEKEGKGIFSGSNSKSPFLSTGGKGPFS